MIKNYLFFRDLKEVDSDKGLTREKLGGRVITKQFNIMGLGHEAKINW